MLRLVKWHMCLRWAVIPAVIFSIAVFFYIDKADYSLSWILFLGSILFFFCIAIFTVVAGNKKGMGDTIGSLVFASYLTTVFAILLCLAGCIILLYFMEPGFISTGPVNKLLKNEPPAAIIDKTNGMVFNIFMTAVVVNFSGGSLVGILIPFYVTKIKTSSNWQNLVLKKNIFLSLKNK